jgi:predicted MFS family arabinose efflux permease
VPLVFALAAKETSEETRTLVSGLIGTAVSAGAAVGQVLNGLLLGWRSGYFVAGVCGVIASLAIHSPKTAKAQMTASSPWTRGLISASSSTLSLDFRLYSNIFDTSTNKIVFIQSIFGNIAWSVIAVFLADFIHAELHYSKPLATLAITCFGLGGLLANFHGSKYGQTLYNVNRKQELVYLLSFPAILGSLPMTLLILLKPSSFLLLLTLLVASAVAAVPGPNLKGLLLAANAQEQRAAVFSAFQLVEMLGKGCGPILVSVLGLLTASRGLAMGVAILGWAVSGGICLMLRECIERDTDDKNVVFTAFFDIHELSDKIEKIV